MKEGRFEEEEERRWFLEVVVSTTLHSSQFGIFFTRDIKQRESEN